MRKMTVQLGIASALLCLCAGCNNWYPLGHGIEGSFEIGRQHGPQVRSLETYNGDLYAGGTFTTAGRREAMCIAKWRQWEPLGEGIAFSDGSYPAVFAMKDYNSSLIVGGQFNRAGGRPAENVARWVQNPAHGLLDLAGESGTWGELPGLNGAVRAFATFRTGGEDWLVAGGEFGGHVVRWREGEARWQPVGDGLRHAVEALVVVRGVSRETLVAAGGPLVDGSSVAYLDTDDTWKPLGDITHVKKLAIYRGELYAAGDENPTGRQSRGFVKRWTPGTTSGSGTWQTVGLLEGASDTRVDALTVYNDTLVVGGIFSRSRGVWRVPVETRNIARWDGTAWQPLRGGISTPVSEDAHVTALTTYAGDQLIAGGYFRKAGGVQVNSIAGWRDGD